MWMCWKIAHIHNHGCVYAACQAGAVTHDAPLTLARLDLAQLSLFVGQRADALVLSRLHARGFDGLRISHGYLIQHVVEQERSISELAERMGVTQQAASKAVRELVELGYLELAAGRDARQRMVRLSSRGREALASARKLRAELERRLLRTQPPAAVTAARSVLASMLEQLGGLDSVRSRKVVEPR
jgi:DNA-binding MarR family transcriptional regulator